MAKPTKSSPKPRPPVAPKPAQEATSMTGIQKVAWWSVPCVGVIALGCATTLGILFATQTRSKPANNASPRVAATSADTPETKQIKKPETKQNTEAEKAPKVVASQPTLAVSTTNPGLVASKPEIEPAPSAEAKNSPPAKTETAASISDVTPAAQGIGQITLLECIDGKLNYAGTPELVFVDHQPPMELTEVDGVQFGQLHFNGVDQSIELPDIPKDAGTLEIVAKMPATENCIALDSSYQRFTIRKNTSGLRWRIEGKKKQDNIRISPTPVNFNQWHHIALTWKTGEDAVLYVDGVEHDRMPYVHEQIQFPNFKRVVLGKTRGPNERYYEVRLNRYTVYDSLLPAEEIAVMSAKVRQKYSFMFE